MNFETILLILMAYLFGSISSAVITCKLLGLPDPRTQGSGNPGATNVLRIGGKKAAIITLVGDFLKGVIPVLIAKALHISDLGLACVTFAAFFGHLYPLFFKFQGGKGVATAFGCMTALSWPVGVCLLVTWLDIAFMFRYSSLAALVTALSAPFFTYFFTNTIFTLMVTIMSFFLIIRHRKNIQNLFTGKENKIGKKKQGK